MCERCAELEAENTDLRKELSYEIDQALWLSVIRSFGLTTTKESLSPRSAKPRGEWSRAPHCRS